MNIEAIRDAFSPAQEIQKPSYFVGRREEMKDCLFSLSNRNSLIAIYGLRGVGKSSIAYQLKLIAQGDNELPRTLDLMDYVVDGGFNLDVIYLKCDKFVNNIEEMIARILFGGPTNTALIERIDALPNLPDEIKEKVEKSLRLEPFRVGGEEKEVTETTSSIPRGGDLLNTFYRVLNKYVQENQDKDGLLILVDEFDLIKDKRGFSSIDKAIANDFVKFGIVGIGTNIDELIKDHQSSGRKLDPVVVERMRNQELRQILHRAESRADGQIIFTDKVKDEICEVAEGFPYFVHLIGRHLFRIAYEDEIEEISSEEFSVVMSDLQQGELGAIYEDMYQRAVKHSEQREIVLTLFAEDERDEIPTGDIYPAAKDMGVTNPSQLMQVLTTSEDSQPILKEVRSRTYRFSDPVFKVYAKNRNWEYR